MPLLKPELTTFPENLFDRSASLNEDERWWVLHTRPRSEKLLARRLVSRQTSFFLPQHRRSWRYRGRKLASFSPLFTGYVFVFGDRDARLHALETNLVVNTLVVPDQTQLHHDLQRVHRLMESGLPIAPEERLQPGKPVEIVDGPFAGMEGTVIQRNKLRFVIEVRLLQQGISVELDGWMIRPISRRPSADESARKLRSGLAT